MAEIIAHVSGQTLADFMDSRIFKPLDMRDTGYYVPPKTRARLATVYERQGDNLVAVNVDADFMTTRKPCGSGVTGLVSTARDYIRFCQMLLNGGTLNGKRILKKQTVEMMTSQQLPSGVVLKFPVTPEVKWRGLGFGVRVLNIDDPQSDYWFAGMCSTYFTVSPQEQLILVLLTQRYPYEDSIYRAVELPMFGSRRD
jgi:CubicO group peptidase (beta-lactamase class C family)